MIITDSNGCEWDWDSSIKEDDKEAVLDETKWSKLLKTIYEIMQKSQTVYVIRMGETSIGANGDKNPGEFNSETNVITLDKDRQFTMQTFLEEMYHAYQKESRSLDSFNNQEFEAKVATTAIISEGSRGGNTISWY